MAYDAAKSEPVAIDFRTGLPVPAELRGKLYSPHDLTTSAFAAADAAFTLATKGLKPPRVFSHPSTVRCSDLDNAAREAPSDEIEAVLADLQSLAMAVAS